MRGMSDGLDPARRVRALHLLERAANQGGDRAAVVDLSRLISRCPEAAPARTPCAWLRKLVTASLAGQLPRARWLSWVACLVLLSQALFALSITVLVPGRFVTVNPVSSVCQVLSALSVIALAVVALVRLRRHRPMALRLARYGALITVLTTDLFDFPAEELVVFSDIAVGLFMLAVLIQQIRGLAPDPLG
jgi:low affinity Fe/Cu permease